MVSLERYAQWLKTFVKDRASVGTTAAVTGVDFPSQ